MKWLSVGLVLLITVLPFGHGYYGSYRDSSKAEENSKKLSTLEKQLKVVINELKALKEDVKILKGEPISESDPDLLPLEVSRIMRPGGRVRFTLKYKAKPAILGQLQVSWVDTERYQPIQESVSNVIPRLPTDVYQSSIETEASNTSHVSVSVGSFEFWYGMDIENALKSNAVQIITSLPDGCIVNPQGDIVYEPGTNASIQLSGPLEAESPDHPGHDIGDITNIQFYINPPGTDDILDKYGPDNVLDNFIEKGEEEIFFDKREFSVIFNTSVVAYSGLVMVMFRQTYRNDMVRQIEKNYMLPLRPSNQSEAFREGVLTFHKQPWQETNANGDKVERCRRDEQCQVYCQLFGNHLNQVVMLRTVNGVVETVIPSSQEKTEFMSYAMNTFYMTSNPKTINFTCVGSNAGGQRVVSTHMVYLYDPPIFVDNQTTIEVSPEGDVNVTCTATGSSLPQMNITFPLQRRMESEHDEDDLEVLYQTNDTISVSKVVTLNDFNPDIMHSLFYAAFAYCNAANAGGEDTRPLFIPDETLPTAEFLS